MMNRHAPLRSRDHEILDPDVGKRAARHHEIVAATRTVTVEIGRLDAARFEILPGRRSRFDRAGR